MGRKRPPQADMKGRRVIYLVALAGCWIFNIAYRHWFSGFALTAMLCLPIFSLLISLAAMRTAWVELRLPETVIQGTEQELALFYGSKFPTPPWRVRVSVECPLTSEKWIFKEVRPLPAAHCGTLLCHIQKARVCDYLGLISIPMKKGVPQRLVVLPKGVPMQLTGLENAATKAWKPKRGGGFAENHELRLYRPGDSVQQIHWKLSAKTGALILREPMLPVQRRLLVRLDLKGSREELDKRLGQFLWLGQRLLEKDLHFELQALTGEGMEEWKVSDEETLHGAMKDLLSKPRVVDGSLQDKPQNADWQVFLGGDAHEA